MVVSLPLRTASSRSFSACKHWDSAIGERFRLTPVAQQHSESQTRIMHVPPPPLWFPTSTCNEGTATYVAAGQKNVQQRNNDCIWVVLDSLL